MTAKEALKELEQTDGFLLTAEDRVFAQGISDEFAIPFEEVCIEMGMIHGAIQGDIEQYNNLRQWNITEHQRLKDSLQGMDYRLFEKAINKVSASCDKSIQSENNPFSQSRLNRILRMEPLSAFLPAASVWNRRIIIGHFLVYFKVDPTIPTEEAWNNKPTTEAQDYKHFLADTVKTRLKQLQK